MKMDLEKTHLITHAGCLDGAVSSILFMHAGGLKKNVHYVVAGQVEEFLSDGTLEGLRSAPLLIVDVCPTTQELAEKLSRRADTFVIDHHKTASKFQGLPGFLIDVQNSACGCENFRQWLVTRGFDEFDLYAYRRICEITDDHDRWQRKIPFSIEMPKLMSLIGQREFVERMSNVRTRFAEEKDSYWNAFEAELVPIISRSQDRRFDKLLDKFFVRDEDWSYGRRIRVGYLISSEINNSELMKRYLDRRLDVDVACQINLDLGKVGIRSRTSGVDVSDWAVAHGGGGHRAAAGYSIAGDITQRIVEELDKDAIRD